MSGIVDWVRERLLENADEKTRASSKRFFKEEIRLYGVRTAVVTQIGKQAFKQVETLPKNELFALCEELWQSGSLEESFIACNWAYAVRKRYQEEDFARFEHWIKDYVNNWASCDTLCNHTLGAFLERYPKYAERLLEWCASANRWVRRASAVSLILPARKGQFKAEIFAIADQLLQDPDDLVQKGCGWMLKSLATANEEEVYRYVLDNRALMKRTALRYAIEKMPAEKRREAMKRL